MTTRTLHPTLTRFRVMTVLLLVLAVLATLAALVVPVARSADTSANTPAAPLLGAVDAEAAASVPRPDHVVVVMLENKNASSIIGSSKAPYLNSLAKAGASMTASYGITHPSQPNYLALFSGGTRNIDDDSCPHTFSNDNLGSQLRDANLSFAGYSESLPKTGYTGCKKGDYQRKHAPWVNFSNLPASVNKPFTAFEDNYNNLPTVSFVTPNMCSDMHDCSVATGDAWVKKNLGGYASWAKTHNSLLVVTFDEDNHTTVNKIATIFVGQKVRPGTYSTSMNHYTLLRTLQTAYGLGTLGHSKDKAPLTNIWTTSASMPVERPITNGSFEDGTNGWATSGKVYVSANVHTSGDHAVRLGSRDGRSTTSKLTQTIVAPSGAKTASFAWTGRCDDQVANAWTTVTLEHNTSNKSSTPLARTCSNSKKWHTVSFKVTPDHSYTIALLNHDDNEASTPNVTYFDNVKFN